jgi:diaminohydroxyphosphoribosylaminopyrimidine deaminase/5-amino-6-(5-phosphoribosylamino)uracil reductase
LDAVLAGARTFVNQRAADDSRFMSRALALAVRGQGLVEPNPMVGCVLVRDGQVVGDGFHKRFGELHAEMNALAEAGNRAAGATAYVTLEPCCHHGKTPPCTAALIQARVQRVVIAVQDPFPQVNGAGIRELRQAGIECDLGVHADQANWILGPYRKLVTTGRPWVIAKWAMTLDGKLATRSGDSHWISSEASRRVVHQLRGQVDAIMVGSGTALKDDPLLTARPADHIDLKRVATRIVVDSKASLSMSSRLVHTASEVPVLLATASDAPANAREALSAAGVEVYNCTGSDHLIRLETLLDELGRRRMTNVLVEGGSQLLGTLFDLNAIDEVHVFIAPKLAGGASGLSPIGGSGISRIASALRLADFTIEELDGDVYVHGRLRR